MPTTSYLNITIAGQQIDVGSIEDFPISVSYSLEDPENFQNKKSAEALNVKVPATLQNRKVANSYHNPSIEDATPGQQYRSHQPAIIEADGTELLNGKAFLVNATHGSSPREYEFDFYGGNGDWIVDLKEKTLYDFISHITFGFNGLVIALSWLYDGRSEALPYVFAPAKYRGMMDDANSKDDNVTISYMRPSISKYWLLYWTFKSLGYRIQSEFLDTDYFRRQVMPWTWGNFLNSEGTKLDVHKFTVKSDHERFINSDYEGWVNAYVSNETTEGAFDNNQEYDYLNNADMVWEYKAPGFGTLNANFYLAVTTNGNIVGSNSYFHYAAHFFHYVATTGITTELTPQQIVAISGRNLSRGDYSEFTELFFNVDVNPGDKVITRLGLKLHEGKGIGARVNFHTKVEEYSLKYFRIPIGGTINFANFTGFKKFKILDFIAGVFDEFNIVPVTDNINKVVYLEPTHAYNVDGTVRKGYFNNDFIDWQDKGDYSKDWKLDLYSDYEKEVVFRYKDDSNDGVLKTVQDRNQNILAAGKYLFPDRFKAGKREHENRFFAPTVHCDAEQFKGITGITPQMVCIVPENISNTSNSEADNTFIPKSCYYKGYVEGVGGWRFEGEERTGYPFMFAVNYKPGGENDPVLSYSDENINGVLAKGLMKHFFAQRLAIMRNGQFYSEAHIRLNNNDVNRLHREHKLIDGQRWELVQINNYLPLRSESTACYLRKWSPILQQDYLNSFPSHESVLNNNATGENDIKYAPLKCLQTDIPK